MILIQILLNASIVINNRMNFIFLFYYQNHSQSDSNCVPCCEQNEHIFFTVVKLITEYCFNHHIWWIINRIHVNSIWQEKKPKTKFRMFYSWLVISKTAINIRQEKRIRYKNKHRYINIHIQQKLKLCFNVLETWK